MKVKLSIMRTGLFLFIVLATSFSSFAASTDTIPANDALIEYTGRISFTNPLAPAFSYSGVSIRACFTGTSVAMIMNDNLGKNYYNLVLDGKVLDTVHITIGQKTYKIAQGLANTTHEIEIIKRTEEQFGKTQFYGLVVDSGATLVPQINPRPLLIEHIGNSITCGYGNEGVNGDIFGPTSENHYQTYAAITSRSFNARNLAVCKSGIGVYRNYAGPDTGNLENMTNIYTRIFATEVNPKYSFPEQPDLICVDLGTNDFSTTLGDSARFVRNFFRFIDTLETKYSNPEIICLVGPLLGSPALPKVKRYINFVVDSANKKGKGVLHFFEMSQQTGDLGIGVDYHPTVAQHKKNAMELTNYIKSLKNWKISPFVLNASLSEAKHLQLEFNSTLEDPANDFSGFTITGNGEPCVISQIIRDTANTRLLHFYLQESRAIGETIKVNYTPGTVQSTDTIILAGFTDQLVQNKLTETKITKGSTSSDGMRITLSFSKSLLKSSTLEGLTITNTGGTIEIDSFSIINSQLTIYLVNPVTKSDALTASYNGSGILGIDDIVLTAFTNLEIKNNSKYTDLDVNVSTQFDIYPNPNKTGVFYYNLGKQNIHGSIMLNIISMNGSVVYKQELKTFSGQFTFDNQLPKGIYTVKITFDGQIIQRQIILE